MYTQQTHHLPAFVSDRFTKQTIFKTKVSMAAFKSGEVTLTEINHYIRYNDKWVEELSLE